MRVGLTGASGFIASALASTLSARGDEVVRFVRPESPATNGPSIRWDPARGVLEADDARGVGALDAVVNLAGAGIGDRRWSEARRALLRSSRLDATDLIVQSLSTLGALTLINGSAIGYYGSRGDEVLDENSSAGDDFLARLCVDWEAAAERAPSGVRVAHLRTGIVLDVHGARSRDSSPSSATDSAAVSATDISGSAPFHWPTRSAPSFGSSTTTYADRSISRHPRH